MDSILYTPDEALLAGFTEKQVRRRVAAGKWRRMFRGIYFASSTPPTFEQWCSAALKAAGPDSLLWGASAARLQGLDGFTPAPGKEGVCLPIVVAVPRDQKVGSQPNLTIRRANQFPAVDVDSKSEIPCVTAVRALIELSEEATWRNIVCAFEHLHRQGKHEELAGRIDVLRNGRGWIAKPEALMSRRGPSAVSTESAAEAICDDILWRGGLRAERQHKVKHGATERRLDLAFPALKLGIECDSRQWHTAKDAFERDRKRWTWLAARGWQLVNFTWAQLSDEAYVLRSVREAIQARATLRVA